MTITSNVATVVNNYSYRFGKMAVIHCTLKITSARNAWTTIASMGSDWAADQAVFPLYGQTPGQSYIYCGKQSASIYTSGALSEGTSIMFCGAVILL